MKLLIISSAFPPFRAPESAHVLVLCEEMARHGVDVHLLTTKRALQGVTCDRFQVHPVMQAWDWKRLPFLLEFVRKLRPDAVLLVYIDWIYSLHLMVTLLPAFLKRLLPRTPFITQFENVSGLVDAEPPRSRSHRTMTTLATLLCARRTLHRIYGALLRDSDRVIALSEHHLEVFERECPGVRAKATVLPAPALLGSGRGEKTKLRAAGRASLGVDDETLLLAYFGYIYPGKGIETLLRACASLRMKSQLRSLKLVVIGAISDRRLAEELPQLEQNLGLHRSVIWTGYVESDATASAYLDAADIAVLPYDAGVRLNNSSFAACAMHGLPIVTTRGEQLESAFQDRENVALCPPADPDALADTIEQIGSSPVLREKLGRGAEALARMVLDPVTIVNATLKVIEGACAQRSGGKGALIAAAS